MIIHEIHMDLVNRGTPWRIDAVQGEKGSRSVKVHLYEAGQPWEVPGDLLVSFRYQKPNNKSGSYSTREDGSNAWTADGNVLIVSLEKQVLNVSGVVTADIVLTKVDYILATFPVLIYVSPSPDGESDVPDDVDNATLDQIQAALNNKGDDLDYDSEQSKLFLSSNGQRIGNGVTIESGSGGTTVSMVSKDYGYDMNLVQEGAIESYPLSLLPEVTAANNGSILRVVDGKWAVADAPESTLPDASEVAY